MAKKTTIKGLDQVQKNLKAAGKRWERAIQAGAYLEMSNIMAHSKRLVPVDLGTLKGSGYVTMPIDTGRRVVIEAGYGGPAAPYVVRQHEDLSLNHPDGGQARFLAAAIEAREGQILGNIRKLAQAAFEANQGPKRGQMPVDPNGGEEG